MPVSTVRNILKNIKENGHSFPKPRSGRPKALTEREKRSIITEVKRNPSVSSNDLSKELEGNFGKKIHPRSVRRFLQANDLRAFRRVKKNLLTEKMKAKRLQWAKKFSDKTADFWRQVLFSDESYISLFCGQPIYARRALNSSFTSKFVNQSPKHPLKVMIWGCFASSGVGKIKVVDSTMKTDAYIEVLEKKMIPSAVDLFNNNEFIFQDDSAPCHRSAKTKNWASSKNITSLEWPGNSPDLNPIENLWAIVKKRIHKYRPTTKETLIAAIIKVWFHEITPETCKKLIDSMPRRIQSVIDKKGGHTKY